MSRHSSPSVLRTHTSQNTWGYHKISLELTLLNWAFPERHGLFCGLELVILKAAMYLIPESSITSPHMSTVSLCL